jgi:hypothetical protein
MARSQLIVLGLPQSSTHRYRGPDSAQLVVDSGKQQQQGVATELEQAASLLGSNGEHPGEDVVQDLGQLLGSDATASGETLGQGREAGDVDKTQ